MCPKSRKIPRSKPTLNQVSIKLQQAFAFHKNGQLDQAKALYEEILNKQPNNIDALHLLGVVALQANQPQQAIDLIDKAIAIDPSNAIFYYNRGNALNALKQLKAAVDSYDKVIKLNPDYAEAYFARGNVLKELEEFDPAIASYDKAIQLNPDYTYAYFNRGGVLKELQKFDAAIASYDKAIQLKPDYIDAYYYRGVVLKELQKFDSAIENFDKAIQLKPDYIDAYYCLGMAQYALKLLDAAIVSYDKAIQLKPDYADAYYNRGGVLKELQKFDAAIASYDKAIQFKPGFPQAYYNRGNIETKLNQFNAAIASYDKAIELKPELAEAHSNRGIALRDLTQLDAAIASYDKAIQLKPDYAEAYYNRGIALTELNQFDAAIVSYDKATSIKPDYADAYSNRGVVLGAIRQFDAALASYNKAIQLEPNLAKAYSNRANTLRLLSRCVEALGSVAKAIQINPNLAEAQQVYSSISAYLSDYRDVIAHSDIALALDSDNPEIYQSRLYTWIYHPDLSAEEICAEHVRWGERFLEPPKNKFPLHDRTLNRRLRVGYVSPDFREHTCRFYFMPLFSQHDHTKFELFAYSNVGSEDEYTQQFKTYFDTWRNIHGVSDQEVDEMVRRDQIDILVDGCGHMLDTRLSVFALKPAPIQVTWLGSAWTTGLKQMDYVLFDPYMAPQGTYTSEVIVRLPRTWAAYRPSEKATKTAVTILPALENGYITFGYSGRSERLNYKVFRAWGALLKRMPQARLIIDFKVFADPPTQIYYQDFMNQHGVDVSRVTMRNSANIYAGLGEVDIILDSFPHSGGTMLFDALWMGVPTVTLASRPPVGRIGASLMTNLGLASWVAQDEESYVNKAVEFASDFEELAKLRAGMRERMSASPLMDEASFARDVENAYLTMWRQWCGETK